MNLKEAIAIFKNPERVSSGNVKLSRAIILDFLENHKEQEEPSEDVYHGTVMQLKQIDHEEFRTLPVHREFSSKSTIEDLENWAKSIDSRKGIESVYLIKRIDQ